MLRISGEQMDALGADARNRYEARLADEMSEAHPGLDDAEVQRRVAERVQASVAAGVTDEATVTRHVRTTFALEPMPAPPAPPAPRARTDLRVDPASQSTRTVGSAVQSCLGWVGIELVDDDGNPIPDQPFVIELPDGTKRTGLTGGDGTALVVGVANGTCKVSFPRTPKAKKA